jgi:hypothetical protein
MNSVFNAYLITGLIVCLVFGTAAMSGWHLPSNQWGGASTRSASSSNSSSRSSSSRGSFFGGASTSGRSSGGFWGGGK